jgi:hypothetical protein
MLFIVGSRKVFYVLSLFFKEVPPLSFKDVPPHSLPFKDVPPHSLPFKGRVGEGMG